MSNLTKEECVACLSYEKNMSPTVKKCFEILIEEHFDNPPLKFEELKPNMWVWDNELKIYYQFKHWTKGSWFVAKYLSFAIYDSENRELNQGFMEFKENRFYAKEVKDGE